MVINVLNHVPFCFSSDQGDTIRALVEKKLASNEFVTVSFSGVSEVTSSFINSAFVSLLKSYDIKFIKSHVRFVSVSKQVADMLRRCFDNAQKEHLPPVVA